MKPVNVCFIWIVEMVVRTNLAIKIGVEVDVEQEMVGSAFDV